MLDNSQNVLVTGGTFTQVEQHGTPGFTQLRAAIADGAMHDSGERFDPPKCYPGTREVILKKLLDWIIAHVPGDAFIHWVQGTAGGGKSAILQEIAEMCAKQQRLIASFFFSRTATLRNNEKRLVATIAYQLAQSIPATRPYIEKAIENDPAILAKSLDSQLLSLVIAPLDQAYSAAGEGRANWPRLILLDGLDECGEGPAQQRLLNSLAMRVAECKFPLLLLVSSRPEIHLVTTFNQAIFKGKLSVTVLDKNYKPDEDIRRFLEGTFKDIKENHPLRCYLPPDWPLVADMKHLIRKSSGHFIYAATVARYVSPPDSHPAQCLDVILRLASPTEHESPFAELDALYSHILSSLPVGEIWLHILALIIFPHIASWSRTPQIFDTLLGLRDGFSQQIIHKLASVVKLGRCSKIEVAHASLADFLFDKSRSERFYINIRHHATCIMRLNLQISVVDTIQTVFQRSSNEIALHCCRYASPTQEILEHLLAGLEFLATERKKVLTLGSDQESTWESNRCLVCIGNHYFQCIETFEAQNNTNIGERYQEYTQQIAKSQVELYRSSDILTTLLVLSSVQHIVKPEVELDQPSNILITRPVLSFCQLLEGLLWVQELISPYLEGPNTETVIKFKEWSSIYVVLTEMGMPYCSRVFSLVKGLLEDRDFTRAAIVMMSSFQHFFNFATEEPRSPLFYDIPFKQQWTYYQSALEVLPWLLPKASNDPKLLSLLQTVTFPKRYSHFPQDPGAQAAIHDCLMRFESAEDASSQACLDRTEKGAKVVQEGVATTTATTVTEEESQGSPEHVSGSGAPATEQMSTNQSDGDELKGAEGKRGQTDAIQVQLGRARKARWSWLWTVLRKKLRRFMEGRSP